MHADTPRKGSLTAADRAARALGWFSLALGAVELFAPGRLGRAVGLEGRETLLRGYGVREIGAGVAALSDTPAPAIWARAMGDLVDMATLAPAARRSQGAVYALVAVAAITLIDIAVASALTRQTARSAPPRDYSDRSGLRAA